MTKVLIIDDDIALLSAMTAAFALRDFETFSASDGRQGLKTRRYWRHHVTQASASAAGDHRDLRRRLPPRQGPRRRCGAPNRHARAACDRRRLVGAGCTGATTRRPSVRLRAAAMCSEPPRPLQSLMFA
jgi:hypothetical protein